ncbi:MAG: WYL domain-containing protein [Bacteroidia bacterium]|nr:WYL domain-containing protein [Bacteroidia bacterium]
MPTNRNALIRYRTIDKCLRNRYRKWTLNNLIEACSEALYEFEGIEKGVSRRTVQADIQVMRSEKLGYEAPIVVLENKYYTYSDPDYSIVNLPLSETDLEVLNETVLMLKQFKGFSHFRELEETIQKLENKVYTETTHQRPLIDLEKNEDLQGLQYLDELYQAILQKKNIKITYQSFKAHRAAPLVIFPYILKEYRNRWFLVGKKPQTQPLIHLALDRIQAIAHEPDTPYKENPNFDPQEYFGDIIGVTKNLGLEPGEIIFWVRKEEAPYLKTKPMHHSQIVVEEREDGTLFSIFVRHNYELEREILGFGESLKILSPARLQRRMALRASKMAELYDPQVPK